MAFGRSPSMSAQAPIAEINTTPLVDVMLVLLIIFIITAPLMTHSVPVDLPRTSSTPTPEKPMNLPIAIDAAGRVHLGGEVVSTDQLEQRFRASVGRNPQVEMRLMVDRNARYEVVADTLTAARRAGIARIGFVTQPLAN